MKKLSPKRELFCQKYVEIGSKSLAYRVAYTTQNMKPETINNKAYVLSNKDEIRARVEELQKALTDKNLYELEESVKKDLNLIQKYEDALEILSNEASDDETVTIAQRTIKFIGSNGYSSAQDRLSKQLGFFEKNNSQKGNGTHSVIILPDNGRRKKM